MIGDFRDGLNDWLRALITGDDETLEAIAAGEIVAEAILRQRLYLKSKFE